MGKIKSLRVVDPNNPDYSSCILNAEQREKRRKELEDEKKAKDELCSLINFYFYFNCLM
jgi:hypothetical protein